MSDHKKLVKKQEPNVSENGKKQGPAIVGDSRGTRGLSGHRNATGKVNHRSLSMDEAFFLGHKNSRKNFKPKKKNLICNSEE